MAPWTGINTPYTLLISIFSQQLTSLLPRSETVFHFTFVKIFEQNPHHWNYYKTKFWSSKLFKDKILHHRSFSITKPTLASISDLENQPTWSPFPHWKIFLAVIQKYKDTWPSECKYPLHDHNIHKLATIHMLNSTRRNSSQPPRQFLTSLTWLLSSLLCEQKTKKTINQQSPKEHELQPNSWTSMMVFSDSFNSITVRVHLSRISWWIFDFQIQWVPNPLVIRKM